ncbi:hypothetical protein BST95_18050 [Halioglobus japonicus]|uniref:Bacteriocin n=1 Tax=Halioglobus japonicus TaxID=930805 RepID=A0AAP8MFV5_9GAMM|nr:hypothetical protein [Halioglobus japonicus]AQA19866.1 hypothetical protein BST95_18050 [Halioglobus japonicus]PLW87058.1 hypothetical protein C0029_00175 [Halioglobus japonicus]GHD10429.1 hypothetical protein GCM10007052_09700 [Halioglobus japonicus]
MTTHLTNSIRPLIDEEISTVSGGIAPIVVAGASLAMNSAVRSLGTALVSRGLAVYAIYDAAKFAGGSGGSTKRAADETTAN